MLRLAGSVRLTGFRCHTLKEVFGFGAAEEFFPLPLRLKLC